MITEAMHGMNNIACENNLLFSAPRHRKEKYLV
jgi:hypothetical protein